jgi:predicted transcriptional regulator
MEKKSKKRRDAQADKVNDRHKPSFMVRVPMAFADGLDEMVERNVSDRTEEVKTAIREYLQRHGLWRRGIQSDERPARPEGP